MPSSADTTIHRIRMPAAIIVVAFALVLTCSCRRRGEEKRSSGREADGVEASESGGPTSTQRSDDSPSENESSEIPRFAANSPFVADYNLPGEVEGKKIWARSLLWDEAPKLFVEKWLTPKPDMKGKYVLLEYWSTDCSQCRLAIAVLNEIHRRFRDEMVVIGISDESEEQVRSLVQPRIEYHLAIDTQARMKNAVGVVGIPHVIIVEPDGYVVWEGVPLLKGYELTTEVVERILKVHRTDISGLETILQ